MCSKPVWNDETRDTVRDNLRGYILGELRLQRRDRDEILESCREVYIQDDVPESELSAFMQFAKDEIGRTSDQIAAEMATWPDDTDCDRLDRAEAALRERGILLWQASPCCDSCTGGELPDRIDAINGRFVGFRDRVRGYAFFIDQNLPDMLAENTDLSVYLGYGWFAPGGAEVAPDVYQANALAIAQEVCDGLRAEGFEPDWNGSFDRKVGVSLNWQRRTPLE